MKTAGFHVRTLAIAAVVVVMIAGCDPVRTTSQIITFRVVDHGTMQPVTDAKIKIKRAWASVYPTPEMDKIAKDKWEEESWIEGVTDAHGEVRINIIVTSIDNNSDSTPHSMRDVDGRKYILIVTANSSQPEETEVKLTAGAQVNTENFSLEVAEIGKAVYKK